MVIDGDISRHVTVGGGGKRGRPRVWELGGHSYQTICRKDLIKIYSKQGAIDSAHTELLDLGQRAPVWFAGDSMNAQGKMYALLPKLALPR